MGPTENLTFWSRGPKGCGVKFGLFGEMGFVQGGMIGKGLKPSCDSWFWRPKAQSIAEGFWKTRDDVY